MLLKDRVLIPVGVLRVLLYVVSQVFRSVIVGHLPVHWVALPDHDVPTRLDGLDVRSKH